jgi:hypothetical protein
MLAIQGIDFSGMAFLLNISRKLSQKQSTEFYRRQIFVIDLLTDNKRKPNIPD